MAIGVASVLMCGLDHCTPAWTRRQWVHETYAKFYIVVGGRARYENEAGVQLLNAGHVYFFPPHQRSRHDCAATMDVLWLHLSIDAPVLDLRLSRLRRVQTWRIEDWSFWEPIYRRIPELRERPPMELELSTQAMIMHAFSSMLAAHPEDDPELSALRRRYEPALRFMDAEFKRHPPLAEVAAEIGVSVPHFHRGFRQAFRTTPHRYMLRRRMDVAHHLLTHSLRSIGEIAMASGYDDQFYFSRVFKRWFHRSPDHFRAARGAGP